MRYRSRGWRGCCRDHLWRRDCPLGNLPGVMTDNLSVVYPTMGCAWYPCAHARTVHMVSAHTCTCQCSVASASQSTWACLHLCDPFLTTKSPRTWVLMLGWGLLICGWDWSTLVFARHYV
jgi:hypothetical protein